MFYVLEIQMTDEETVSTITTNHEVIEDAESKFFYVASYIAKSQLYRHTVVLLTEKGEWLNSFTHHYVAPLNEPVEE